MNDEQMMTRSTKVPNESHAETQAKAKQRFLRILRAQMDESPPTYNASVAAKGTGYDRGTIYRWAEVDAEFAAAWRDIHEEFTDLLEATAQARAITGSDLLIIFLLKALRPEKFREQVKHELSGPSGGPIPFVYGDTVAEIAARPGPDSEG